MLCENVFISLWQEKSSLQFSPSFMSILFLPACRFYGRLPLFLSVFPCSSASRTPQALLECWGEIKKRPCSKQVRVFRFFISMTFFSWFVNTRNKLPFDKGYSSSNPNLSCRPFKKHAVWRMSLGRQDQNTLPLLNVAHVCWHAGTFVNVHAAFIIDLIKFELLFVHPTWTNVKKLAGPRNECSANCVPI